MLLSLDSKWIRILRGSKTDFKNPTYPVVTMTAENRNYLL